ncbi:MAG: HIT family protein [Candidatus Zambryskibacteria bacterium CG_4_9_14_3_um_filter_40_16]|uniref:HIT family protein n=2 Tax=Candidatus Zambryskiibacteriota TaxID=1817925 RepID=A0A2H0K6B0_9BACT|nr:MAG: HIT family protein [Candidatus Zambryskibacteria bacterium CG11_big_fil_rev_8_21_14_0_20_40_24]PJA34256.1 MAG: HIT family protein [Candidatus Zambryskibacteria bacterium CG_4_9_14_3_um_filter_40_16]
MNKDKNSNGAGGSINDCVFCKIADKKIPSNLVFEDEHSMAFLDINPVQMGHTLIIPKNHHPQMTDVPEDLLARLFRTAKMIMPRLKKAMGSDFVVLTIVGTDIDHFHIHLIPRFKNDGIPTFPPTKKYGSTEEMKTVEEKIRKEL